MQLDDCHHKFLQYIRLELDYSKATVISYRTDFRQFFGFLESQGSCPEIEDITTPMIREYIYFLSEDRGLHPNSIRRKIHSLSSFFKFCYTEEYISKNPMLRVTAPKKRQPVPIYLPAPDLQKLMDAPMAKGKERTKLRDTLILKTFVFTGIRRSELLKLNWEDIDFIDQTVKIHGKGSKERLIPLPPQLVAELQIYKDSQRVSLASPVFRSVTGRRLSGRILSEMFHRYERKAGIEGKGYSIHKMRHSFATLLLQSDVSVVEIQKLMGHSDISSTLIYAHTTAQRLQDAVQKHPLLDNEPVQARKDRTKT
ncbi:tyrosine-type recombinase/integrase [Alicyclobacillus sp. SO9]|uniref:tyrosine-type recombinase/integrase n=1 Tax=Alicyclobacillus sp. SO9 TaxID=2665646 RepID=UPI0018E6F037|nr:tyrosine-type recombinase/integrase [Alicyclobacillus sp. SO9]QQE77302.1 tyrosine-type recombinase/integrase [Alicyclobacillus sp. SO9]